MLCMCDRVYVRVCVCVFPYVCADKDGINDEDRAFGRESRGLKAAYELLQCGWRSNNMVFMLGGVQQWRHEGLPMEALAE